MVVLLIAIAVGVVVFGVLAAISNVIGAAVFGLVALAITYFLMTKRITKQLEAEMAPIQKQLQSGRTDNAIKTLEGIRDKYANKQFFTRSTLDGQIGVIHFMNKRFDKAQPYLEKSFVRLWNAQAMLGVLHGKNKDYDKMDDTFEKCVKYSPKQGVVWSTWAWIHWKAKHKEKAISILTRGKSALADKDEMLNTNLLALQNDKKMKMKGYGDVWYQFHLETHPALHKAKRGNMRFARR